MTQRPSTLRRSIDARLGLSRPGQPAAGWAVRLPGVVTALLAVMAIVFVIGIALPDTPQWRMEYALGFVPGRLAAGLAGKASVSLIEAAGPLVTHVFVHGNFAHLAINSMGLAIFGTAVARRLAVDSGGATSAWNLVLFLGLFFASGVAGALLYAAFHAGSAILLVGASGAISGLMAGAMRFALRAFAPYGPEEGALSPVGARPVVAASAVYLGLNLMTPLGLGALVGGGQLDIAWEAHVGGYLFGLFAFPLFDRAAIRRASAARYG